MLHRTLPQTPTKNRAHPAEAVHKDTNCRLKILGYPKIRWYSVLLWSLYDPVVLSRSNYSCIPIQRKTALYNITQNDFKTILWLNEKLANQNLLVGIIFPPLMEVQLSTSITMKY